MLQLAEAKDLLAVVQDTVAGQQAAAAITKQVACPDCGRARRHKDTRTIVVRSLFGTLRLASPRWWHCGCRDQPVRTFQPLAGLLPTYDTKPKRRLFEVLRSQGMQANQQVTFLTDGGKDIRDIPCYLNAQAEHLVSGPGRAGDTYWWRTTA